MGRKARNKAEASVVDSIEMLELRDQLQALVNASSASVDTNGHNRVQRARLQILRKIRLRHSLALQSKAISGDLLLAERKGRRPEFITFVAHADGAPGVCTASFLRKRADAFECHRLWGH